MKRLPKPNFYQAASWIISLTRKLHLGESERIELKDLFLPYRFLGCLLMFRGPVGWKGRFDAYMEQEPKRLVELVDHFPFLFSSIPDVRTWRHWHAAALTPATPSSTSGPAPPSTAPSRGCPFSACSCFSNIFLFT